MYGIGNIYLSWSWQSNLNENRVTPPHENETPIGVEIEKAKKVMKASVAIEAKQLWENKVKQLTIYGDFVCLLIK